MCCTSGPAKLANTIIYAGHSTRGDQRVQVLAYQNNAQSYGANAMILPIPTDVALGPDNLVDTREGGAFLGQLVEALKPKRRSLSKSFGAAAGFADDLAEVFESGSYTVVTAQRLSQVREALTRVPANKRPEFTSEFLIGYGKLYQNHKFVICCWEGELEAEPVMLWFVPRDERLFIPTMDAHDGGAPQPGMVETDHDIIVGTKDAGIPLRSAISFKNIPDTIAALLAPRGIHHAPAWEAPNGDTWATDKGEVTRIPLS